MIYRPWGPIDWCLSLANHKKWHFVGAVGTTERSLCCWRFLKQKNLIGSEAIVRIEDVYSAKFWAANQSAFDDRLREFVTAGGRQDQIQRFEIMAELFQILDYAKNKVTIAPSVVLDITAFPKRFFFPILRALFQKSEIKDIILTYTYPACYTTQMLYEDIEPWRPLPGFAGTLDSSEHWIVSVGFLVESLRQFISDNPDHSRMKLLIPYPASLTNLRRTWESVVRLEGGSLETRDGRPRFEKFRVDAFDMSSTFDRIVSLAANEHGLTAFAPFGPKPTSAAMCLYAIQKDNPVYYPQPTVYHPNYAIGIRAHNPLEAITAYWVKHEGENFYQV